MTRFLFLLPVLAALSACSLFDDTDPREGVEDAAACTTRVAGLLGPASSYREFSEATGVPTYTFDITKVGLEDLQALMVDGSDDTAGSRLR